MVWIVMLIMQIIGQIITKIIIWIIVWITVWIIMWIIVWIIMWIIMWIIVWITVWIIMWIIIWITVWIIMRIIIWIIVWITVWIIMWIVIRIIISILIKIPMNRPTIIFNRSLPWYLTMMLDAVIGSTPSPICREILTEPVPCEVKICFFLAADLHPGNSWDVFPSWMTTLHPHPPGPTTKLEKLNRVTLTFWPRSASMIQGQWAVPMPVSTVDMLAMYPWFPDRMEWPPANAHVWGLPTWTVDTSFQIITHLSTKVYVISAERTFGGCEMVIRGCEMVIRGCEVVIRWIWEMVIWEMWDGYSEMWDGYSGGVRWLFDGYERWLFGRCEMAIWGMWDGYSGGVRWLFGRCETVNMPTVHWSSEIPVTVFLVLGRN